MSTTLGGLPNVLDLKIKLEIALRIAQAVAHCHAKHVIHKDICPDNILVQRDRSVVLKASSHSTALTRDVQEVRAPSQLEGNLQYISPEQTGRMNRAMDYRSDLYSLGATLFYLFVGRPPFAADAAAELVHAHIAKTPPPMGEFALNIPEILERIVAKLLSKNPEERYQSGNGVKFDLQNVLSEIEAGNPSPTFPLGQEDVPLRFEVSQRLYGRDTEVARLLNAFEQTKNGGTQFMLVAGYSGIGKTSVINEIRKPIVNTDGFYISGKFEQFNRDVPYSAIAQAMGEIVQQILLSSSQRLREWKMEIQTSVGRDGKILTDLVPALERLIGPQDELPQVNPVDSQKRFNQAVARFLQAFARPGHPLVLFLDDLQWADLPSLNLLETLLAVQPLKNLFLIAAYRENEVSANHAFMMTVERMEGSGTHPQRMHLEPLHLQDIQALVADTMRISFAEALPLSQVVFEKTHGNSFYAVQVLRAMYAEEVISLDHQRNRWTWNKEKAHTILATQNVVELLTKEIGNLPKDTLEILTTAACLGNHVNLIVMENLTGKTADDLRQHLQRALSEGYLVPSSGGFRFHHDKIRQAIYELIPGSEMSRRHLDIGRILLQKMPAQAMFEFLFDTVGHMNLGLELLDTTAEKMEVADLNFCAAIKARRASAPQSALKYFLAYRRLRSEKRWTDDRPRALEAERDIAECYYVMGDFDSALTHAKDAFGKSHGNLERAHVLSLWLQILITQGKDFSTVVSMARTMLDAIGFTLPDNALEFKIYIEKLDEELKDEIGTRKILELVNLPTSDDPQNQKLMDALIQAWVAGYFGQDQELLAFSTYHMVLTSLRCGNMESSAFGYVQFGLYSRLRGQDDLGYQFGQLALNLVREKFPTPASILRVGNIFAHAINPYFNHYETNIPIYLKSFEVAPATTDQIYGVWSALFRLITMAYKGDNLELIVNERDKVIDFMRRVNDQNMLMAADMLNQTCRSLQGKTDRFGYMDGGGFTEEATLIHYREIKYQQALGWFGVHACGLRLIANLPAAEAYLAAQISEDALTVDDGFFPLNAHYFYQTLAICRLIDENPAKAQDPMLRFQISRNVEKLKRLSANCDANFGHRYALARAEVARVKLSTERPENLYDLSIAKAKQRRFLNDQALAEECAALYYLGVRRKDLGRKFLVEAKHTYQAWGATAKVKQLADKYKLESVVAVSHDQLDFANVVAAMQTISQEIQLESLIGRIMEISLSNAGAQFGVLVLNQNGQARIVAETRISQTRRPNVSAEEYTGFAQSIFRSSHLSGAKLVIADANADHRFAQDPHVRLHKVKSVLCLPILKQGRHIGSLYLENRLTIGAFTPERLQLLEILATQAATSLENSMLYQELEKRVEDRTRELQESLEQLKSAQAQLNHSSKMSALGEMAGGVAHEINTPLTVITMRVEQMQETMEEGEIAREELSTALALIARTSARIAKIVNGLRFFARDGRRDDFKSGRITQILDETLSFCRERFQSRGVKLQVNLGEDPDLSVFCRPVEISQVFLNLLNNAFDAIEALPQKWIRIDVEETSETVRVIFTDSGSGIPREIQEKIMQPFFTTKEIGKGTGLGLSISKGVVESHHGRLTLDPQSPNTKFIVELPKHARAMKFKAG